MDREEERAELVLKPTWESAQTNLARLEMPKDHSFGTELSSPVSQCPVPEESENYSFNSNFIPTCKDTLEEMSTPLGFFKVAENAASFEKLDLKHSCIYPTCIRIRSPAKSI